MPTTLHPVRRTSSAATAPVPVATSRTVSEGPASIRETRNRRQRGSWPSDRSAEYRSYVGPSGAKIVRAESSSAMARVYARHVSLSEELDATAAAAARHATAGETLDGILVAEPRPGERTYVCSFDGPTGRSWLALDAQGHVV